MGTLLGHIIPGLALALLGLWHTISTLKSYFLDGPSNFRVLFWYPMNSLPSKFKHIELVFILSFSVLSIITQILDFPFLNFSFKLDNFEHATMFLHLAIFSGFALCAELSQSVAVLSGVAGVLASSVFGQELFLLRFHSADHAGLEGHYHWLLQLIVIASLAAALVVTCCPRNLPAALILSGSVMFQGCWFANMGLVLWAPHLAPAGCAATEGGGGKMVGAIVCSSEGADLRARAVANLQFSWILSGILLLTGCMALSLAVRFRQRDFQREYERVRSKGLEVHVAVERIQTSSSMTDLAMLNQF